MRIATEQGAIIRRLEPDPPRTPGTDWQQPPRHAHYSPSMTHNEIRAALHDSGTTTEAAAAALHSITHGQPMLVAENGPEYIATRRHHTRGT